MEHETTLEQLLTQLASRIDGSIDYWTTLCFLPEGQGLDLQGFLSENFALLRSLLAQIEQVINEHSPSQDNIPGLVQQISDKIELFSGSFLVISCHRHCSVEEVRSATLQLAMAHDCLIKTIHLLGVACGIELTYWQRRTPERENYYNHIIRNLFQLTQEARNTGAIPQSLQMSASVFQDVVKGLQNAGETSDTGSQENLSSDTHDNETDLRAG